MPKDSTQVLTAEKSTVTDKDAVGVIRDGTFTSGLDACLSHTFDFQTSFETV